jgi:glycosyltransferase involved in cell wall biosynthesis
MAFLDIVIPTYRRPAELIETLQSVKQQTFQDLNCWIAEDGETPETRDAVTSFLADGETILLDGWLEAWEKQIHKSWAQ